MQQADLVDAARQRLCRQVLAVALATELLVENYYGNFPLKVSAYR